MITTTTIASAMFIVVLPENLYILIECPGDPGLVAECLDLVGKIDTLVGDDPFQHPHPRFEPFGVCRILCGLLRGQMRLVIELALLHLDPHLERGDPDRGEWYQ